MSDIPTPAEPVPPDHDAEHALSAALRVPALDEQALARMRGAVEREWRKATGTVAEPVGTRPWALRAMWTAAAGLAAIVGAWATLSAPGATALGPVARLEGTHNDVSFMMFRHRHLRVGDALKVGDTWVTRQAALFSLPGGGSLRVAANTTLDILGSQDIRLREGMIYVDKPATSPPSAPLTVQTRAGTIEHLGTAFEVSSTPEAVRVRVREGRVRLHGAAVDIVADAGAEILASANGQVTQIPVSTYGTDWSWLAALTPAYVIEGKQLTSFLQWVGREMGRKIAYASPQARDAAKRIILHGSVAGRDPEDALADVFASTTLSFEITDDTIVVRDAH